MVPFIHSVHFVHCASVAHSRWSEGQGEKRFVVAGPIPWLETSLCGAHTFYMVSQSKDMHDRLDCCSVSRCECEESIMWRAHPLITESGFSVTVTFSPGAVCSWTRNWCTVFVNCPFFVNLKICKFIITELIFFALMSSLGRTFIKMTTFNQPFWFIIHIKAQIRYQSWVHRDHVSD